MNQEYAIYLRKSRVDIEAEASGLGETLSRHRTRLLELARAKKLTVTKIYEEIVSGETITSRPQMQQLLHDVEEGLYAGVLCMEIERLARGDTIDQGIVSRSFQYSGTQIITPQKTYNPASEFDQEYFEFGLFMSRREYKTINRRQQAGRLASVAEGKWCGNKSPYGYKRIKLEGVKGWTLEPTENAPIVQDIFRWYTSGVPNPDGSFRRLGVSLISRKLNGMGIPSAMGKDWTPVAINAILRNPCYAGWVRWGNRKGVKHIKDGALTLSRPRSKPEDVELHKGLHPALIAQEIYDMAQHYLSYNPSRPGPRGYPTTNPLAGIVKCDQCGRNMVRRPYAHIADPPTLMCPYTSCKTVSSHFDIVENMVLSAIQNWLDEFRQSEAKSMQTEAQEERASLERTVSKLQDELVQIDAQESKAFDLVEQGVYSIEIFTARTSALSKRREDIEEKREHTIAAIVAIDKRIASSAEIVPAMQHVLDSYCAAENAGEKNNLLKSCIEKIIYHKTVGGRYRESDLSIKLIPKLPK